VEGEHEEVGLHISMACTVLTHLPLLEGVLTQPSPQPGVARAKEFIMPPRAVYGISIVFSFIVWGMVTARYVWPALRTLPRARALRPFLVLHSFRFIGLAFLVPGVVSPDLPIAFARPAAYGDLLTTVLALLALALLQSRLGYVLIWVFNCCGTADLLYAFYQGNRTGLGYAPGLMGAAYFIPTLLVPLLLITHGLVFRLLFTRDGAGTGRTRPI
jgi:hypothetical protein